MGNIIGEPDIKEYEAGKNFRLGGVDYHPGDPIDVSQLPDHKVKQFLNQRMIRPRAQQ